MIGDSVSTDVTSPSVATKRVRWTLQEHSENINWTPRFGEQGRRPVIPRKIVASDLKNKNADTQPAGPIFLQARLLL